MIKTNRLILREMTDEDKDDFYEIFDSENVDKFVRRMTREQVEKYFAKRKTKPKNPYSFAVVLAQSNKMIGTVGIKETEAHVGTLSYVFNDKYWGNGYCTEACRAVIKNAFENWGFEIIKADCQEDNNTSRHLLDKFGFKFDRIAIGETTSHRTNEPVNFLFFSLAKTDYELTK